jgi:hypothetical protein
MLASVIMEKPGYDEMTPQVLSKLKHHDCLDEDAVSAHNQNPNAMGYNKNATLKATQAHEGKPSSQDKKKVKDDSSSEEEESNEDIALIIRNFRKFIKKKSNRKTYGDGKRRNNKRFYYGCGQTGHFIADCSNENKKKHKHDKDEDKKNKGKKRGEPHLGEEWESNDSDSSDDEKKKKGATNIAIHHSSSPTMIFLNSTSHQNSFPTYLHH